jgi:type 1 fimbria pilin
MAASSYKAVAIAQQLLSDLNQRGPLTFTMGVASDGYPTLTTGSGSAGAQNIAIKVINYLDQQNAAASGASKPLPYKDSLGLNATPFSPTMIQISLEQLAGNTGTLVIKAVNLTPVLAECARRGVDVQVLLTTNTTAPTPGAGTLASDFNDLAWPGINQN